MSCARPIDAALLADYWLAVLPRSEQEAVEEHLLGCDQCGARLNEVVALGRGLQSLARQGSLQMVVSEAFLKCAAEDGLRIREYVPPPGGSVQCTVTAEDDLVVGRLAANFQGAKQVDLCILDEMGAEQARFRDIPLRPDATGVVFQQSITFVKAAPDYKSVVRLVTFDDAGAERLLGEYTFNHRRSLPGPGAW